MSSMFAFGSNKAYISKRKLEIVKDRKEKKGKGKLAPVAEQELERGYSSAESISDEELDKIVEEPEAQMMPMMGMAAPPPPPRSGGLFGEPMPEPTGLMRAPMAAKKPVAPRTGARGLHHHHQEVDTNVVCLNLATLQEIGDLATGDPIHCANCQAYLNKNSEVKSPEKEGEHQSWTCEFCGYMNEVNVEEEEIPKSESTTYLMASPPEPMEEVKGEVEGVTLGGEGRKNEDISLIFCIDISGSMDATVQTNKKMKYGTSSKTATRLQCVKLAIDQQIQSLIKTNPAARVGFVTFENKVRVLGDGSREPLLLFGAVLNNYTQLLEQALGQTESYMGSALIDSKTDLLKTLENIVTGGMTALGPALLVSVGMAGQGKTGSKVVICTDGLANRGMGMVENVHNPKIVQETSDFYERAGEYAKQRGITISVISLVSGECKLEMLSPIANLTGGDILRVNPMQLGDDFAELIAERVIGSNGKLRVQLHKGLEFRNENEEHLKDGNTVMLRDLGNITNETEVTFEYCMKGPNILAAMEIDLNTMKYLPFQTEIIFKSMEGKQLARVVTQQQEITFEKEEAKKEADVEVMAIHAVKQTANLARKGEMRKAQANIGHWANYVGGDEAKRNYMVKNSMPLYQALGAQQKATPMINKATPLIEQRMMMNDVLSVEMNQASKMNRSCRNCCIDNKRCGDIHECERTTLIVFGILAGVLFIAFIILFICCVCNFRKNKCSVKLQKQMCEYMKNQAEEEHHQGIIMADAWVSEAPLRQAYVQSTSSLVGSPQILSPVCQERSEILFSPKLRRKQQMNKFAGIEVISSNISKRRAPISYEVNRGENWREYLDPNIGWDVDEIGDMTESGCMFVHGEDSFQVLTDSISGPRVKVEFGMDLAASGGTRVSAGILSLPNTVLHTSHNTNQ